MTSSTLRHYAEVMDDRARMLGELGVVLAVVGADHALIGGLVAGLHGRERATIDVDLLVPGRKLQSLADALEKRGYRVRRTDDLVQVFSATAKEGDAAVADLVSKDANPVLSAAFGETQPGIVLGHPIRVVTRGAFVALKFHAASSTTRAHADRLQDIVDIERVLRRAFSDEDAAVARRVIAPGHPGAVEELDKLLDDLRAGRPVTI